MPVFMETFLICERMVLARDILMGAFYYYLTNIPQLSTGSALTMRGNWIIGKPKARYSVHLAFWTTFVSVL